MKVKLTLIDGTRKRFNHVAYVSADKNNGVNNFDDGLQKQA
jgi:hypothetical protein